MGISTNKQQYLFICFVYWFHLTQFPLNTAANSSIRHVKLSIRINTAKPANNGTWRDRNVFLCRQVPSIQFLYIWVLQTSVWDNSWHQINDQSITYKISGVVFAWTVLLVTNKLHLYCSFRALWNIKTLVTPTNAQFYNLRIFSIT